MVRNLSHTGPNFLSSRSPEFLFCVFFTFTANLVGCWHFSVVGKRLAPAIRNSSSYLRKPLFPFSVLGSVGADVSDMQFRVFFESLPFVLVSLLAFLCMSHALRLAVRYYSGDQELRASGEISREDGSFSCHSTISHFGNGGVKNVDTPFFQDCVGHTDPKNREQMISANSIHNNEATAFGDRYDAGGGPAVAAASPHSLSNNIDRSSSMQESNRLHSRKLSPFSWFRGDKPEVVLLKNSFMRGFGQASVLQRIPPLPMFLYHVVCGLILVFYVSGPSFIFEMILLAINYFCISPLCRYVPFPCCMMIMWTFMIGSLFSNYYMKGYKLAWLGFSSAWDEEKPLMSWTVHYNMAVLRMIAFNNDFWDAQSKLAAGAPRDEVYKKHSQTCIDCALLREKFSLLQRKPVEWSQRGLPSFGSSIQGEQGYKSPKKSNSTSVMRGGCYSKNSNEETFRSCSSGKVNGTSVCSISSANDGTEGIFSAGVQGESCLPAVSNSSLFDKNYQQYKEVDQELLSCYKCRTDTPHALGMYNLLGYLAFLLYPPLIFSGPMISYNAFASLVRQPAIRFSTKEKIAYGFRVLGNMVFLVAQVHYLFLTFFMFSSVKTRDVINLGFTVPSAALTSVEISEDSTIHILELLSVEMKCYLFYLSLSFLWCKFNVIWKFFRFLAMLDGFDIPEDMPYCFTNTVSISDFWQSWHASFNLWIVRYMYIPMGGKRRKALTIIPIFLFIAVWHDIELRLLKWALVTCVCFIPELAIMTFFRGTTCWPIAGWRQRPVFWRRVREIGATIGQWALICANVIGFSTSDDGALFTMGKIFKGGVSKSFLLCFLVFYICTGKVSVQHRDKKQYTLECTKEHLRRERILPNKA